VFFSSKQQNLYRFVFFPVLVLASVMGYSQLPDRQDPVNKIPHFTPTFNNRENRFIITREQAISKTSQLRPLLSGMPHENYLLLDSLRKYVSRSLIVSKLYDLIVVPSRSPNPSVISEENQTDRPFYSGKRIRKIEIKRLDVFGTNINNPAITNPTKIEKFLNSTHFNTNEFIIRKNLLFSEGDTASPLILTDNERILRQLPYMADARITVNDINEEEVDITIITKDIYSIGADFNYVAIDKGSISLFERNIFGIGHELGIEVPYDSDYSDSPGFGARYSINNFSRSFTDLDVFFLNGLDATSFGFALDRKLLSSTTKYAGGISFRQTITSEDLDSLPEPESLRYNVQDYWISRSFLIDQVSVTRIITGVRHLNNIVTSRPFINPDSYYHLQNYRLYLGSVALSVQKYYKTNLIYNYGRIEDVPYGGMFRLTAGKEISEFKDREYAAIDASAGIRSESLGYFYVMTGLSAFINNGVTEQGLFTAELKYFSNLLFIGRSKIRSFLTGEYTRGFERYADENLRFETIRGLSGFRNDSASGRQRLSLRIESVLFSPGNFYGFKFSPFIFADLSMMSGQNEMIGRGSIISGIGAGLRIRNDNLIFKTFQIRVAFFPNLPEYSRTANLIISGEELLRPDNFDPGPPSILQYR
jgi:hypothetical protein